MSGGRNLYLDPSTRAALIPTADMAVSVFDTLTDGQIDRILAGTTPAPTRRARTGRVPTRAVGKARCSLCGRTGHTRMNCG